MNCTNERRIYEIARHEESALPKEKEGLFSVDTLLNLTETIATMAMGAGFLLLVAAWLASL